MNHSKTFALVLCLFATGPVLADDALVATYLANAGVLISHGETKIVFDPLFDNDYNFYELVPTHLQLFGPSQAIDDMPVDIDAK
jgi:L-ascorbate metabolism protein UlaG (beta-lactamase superfamily)